jgi:ribosomal protein L3 glutamine methyltransferase
MSTELLSIIDLIRFGGSRFNAAGLSFGHSYDNALDEATQLVLHALHLPHDLNPMYGQARVTAEERASVLALFERRIAERIPAAYLTGEAWFAGLSFLTDRRALVPRSPIAELIEAGFQPWLGDLEVRRALDLCTGSGCIGIAMAQHMPEWQVDCVDLSAEALELARENLERLHLGDRVRLLQGDLFAPVAGEADSSLNWASGRATMALILPCASCAMRQPAWHPAGCWWSRSARASAPWCGCCRRCRSRG